MDIHALTYFKRVAELQHITRAAEELHVAQPSLSRTIAGLESDLGVQLFERVGKNIVLNHYGEIVLRHTNRILQEMKDIQTELSDTKSEGNRTVKISLSAASKLIPRLVMDFKKEYPSIRLQIIQQNLNKTQEEECDLAIFSSMQPCVEPNEVKLIEEEIFLALPESSELAKQKSINLRDAANMEFICLHTGKSLRTVTDMYCKMAGFEPTVVLECDSPETVRELICAGLGISFVPAITWDGMETSKLVLRPLSFPNCKRYINLAWRNSGYLSPASILFRDFVQTYFKGLPATKV